MNHRDIRPAQDVMLSLLQAFDKICKTYNLTYWLDHGTLLGAVRDGGFIPWDDDLDVTMPREDYEKFLELAVKELSPSVFLQTKDTDPNTPVHYAKLRDRNSTYIDAWEEGKDICYHQGIFIDIFPVNYIESSKKEKYKNILTLAKIFSNRYVRIDKIAKVFIGYLNNFHSHRNEYIVSGGESMHYVTHVERETVFPLTKMIFEGVEFPVPGKYDKYLVSIFGEAYMDLPSEDKRQVHSISIDVNQKCKYEKERS